MDKDVLFDSLVRWNYWGRRRFENLLLREVASLITPYVEAPSPVVLIGVRRSGKSSLLALLMKYLLEKGVTPSQLFLINFEEPLFVAHLSVEFLEQLVALYRERINPKGKIYFFLDEIQNLPHWERWVRREADLKEHKIFLTGSSAKLLSSEIATLLTGRHYSFFVHPLSFKEFLTWREIEHRTRVQRAENKPLIRKAFFDYLEWGGFPEIVLADSDQKRDKILHQYFDDILFRDIVLRYQIRDVRLLQAVAEYYLTNVASLHSFNRIRNVLQTSLDNVRRYTGFLEESQLLFSLPKFAYKLSEQRRGSRKVYAVDTGLRNAISFRFSRDIGKLVENVVALHLVRRSPELFYFADGGECDFVFQQNTKFQPLQVSFGELNERAKAREIRGLTAALTHTRGKHGILLTDELEGEEQVGDFQISLRPVWKFLLDF